MYVVMPEQVLKAKSKVYEEAAQIAYGFYSRYNAVCCQAHTSSLCVPYDWLTGEDKGLVYYVFAGTTQSG